MPYPMADGCRDLYQPNSLPEIVMPASLITGDSDAAIPSIDIRDTTDTNQS